MVVERSRWFNAWEGEIVIKVDFCRGKVVVLGDSWISEDGLVKVLVVVDCFCPIGTNETKASSTCLIDGKPSNAIEAVRDGASRDGVWLG